jgi:Tfp pilus assembly protein PilV
MIHRSNPTSDVRDRGVALVLVLVLVVVLGGVVLSVASYSTASLSYAHVAEARSDRLAAADAGMRYALDQIKLKSRGCVWDDALHNLPGITSDFNGATASVDCQRITSGLDDIQMYAAVMTGAGLPLTGSDSFLLSSQGGSNKKILGGPVYMNRIDPAAWNFDSASTSAGVTIKNGPLLYFDPTVKCIPVKPSVVVTRANNKLNFDPALVYGPECLNQSWETKFPSPYITRDLSLLPERDGALAKAVPSVALSSVTAATLATAIASSTKESYFDVTGEGGCRVFIPGRYTTPPATTNTNAYFLSGDYVFDHPDSNPTLVARQGIVTAGKVNPKIVGSINERPNTEACRDVQQLDPTPAGQEGATFYFAGKSNIRVETNGALEIHARQQGTNFVSVQTLCKTKGNSGGVWCRDPVAGVGFGGDGGLGVTKQSTLNATTTAEILYTNSGNGKEFIAHALFYAPLAEAEFGNVSNTAVQKMMGGLAVSQLILQAATSATNFEIAVPTSPITGEIQVRSTSTGGGGTTSIQAIVEYRPYEKNVDDRLRVNSWRVCEDNVCS